jgi:hypothetical protein
MVAGKQLSGLEGLFMRFDLRFRRGLKKVSPNPFDKTSSVFSQPTQITSEEFIGPRPEK